MVMVNTNKERWVQKAKDRMPQRIVDRMMPYKDDLVEFRRNAPFREAVFDKIDYKPHDAQWEFHNAYPKIVKEYLQAGNDRFCSHPEATQEPDEDDEFKIINSCPDCGAEFLRKYTNRHRVVVAGARWGKSMSVAKEGIFPLLFPGINPDGTLNRSKAPAVYVYGPTYKIAVNEFRYLVNAMKDLGLQPSQLVDNPAQGNMYARWSWGAHIVVKSWDQPSSLLGDEIDCAILCEAAGMPTEVWERYIFARLSSREGYCVIGSTPQGVGKPFLEDFYNRGQDVNDYEVWSKSFSILTNPYYKQENYMSAKRNLDKRRFDEQMDGKFVSQTGLIYPTYRPEIHVKEQIKFPSELPRGAQVVFSIDWGRRAPTAAIMAYWDSDGVFHVIEEYYVTEKTVKSHFYDKFKDWLVMWQPEWILFDYGDMSATQTLTDEIFKLQQDGQVRENCMKIIPCHKDIKVGIERVRELLHVNPVFGDAKFVCDPSCKNMQKEFRRYCNKKDPLGNIIDKPADGHDHLMDAIRYAVATSYEDGEMRRDRLNMLDMEQAWDDNKDKPYSPIADLIAQKRRSMREQEEEEAEWETAGQEYDSEKGHGGFLNESYDYDEEETYADSDMYWEE